MGHWNNLSMLLIKLTKIASFGARNISQIYTQEKMQIRDSRYRLLSFKYLTSIIIPWFIKEKIYQSAINEISPTKYDSLNILFFIFLINHPCICKIFPKHFDHSFSDHIIHNSFFFIEYQQSNYYDKIYLFFS